MNLTELWLSKLSHFWQLFCTAGYQVYLINSSYIFNECKSRKENPQKPTQLSSRSHPRHLVGKRTAQKTPS